ncbi:rod shape-determining protein MreD [Aphanothece hegewaldii CCALA 016]|uniref:Rod shape-determining protein MreD n=1 Tax=Aphanothece hegewaldii CCALA 016 TaxID=2107694 RepID=A0A2T1LY81_9CHRO|nr:rod shape-determining protein MreD [Aphanothece hegewaldii]PSF37351.1 rod shape-determining protein MreD [Aphanothece hegewaldii CCALA 016]
MIRVAKLSPRQRQLLNGLFITGSVLLCLLLSPTRLPGMALLGIGPNWFLIWVVTWSLKHKVLSSVIAGLILGLLQDSMSSSYPSHVIVLILVGFITARLQRHIKEDLITIVLLVFILTLVAEAMIALQYALLEIRPIDEIWLDYQRIALSCAILSSLWTPAFYYPLHSWWEKLQQ